MSSQPPTDILEVIQNIDFNEALEPEDDRRVDTRQARGSERTYEQLARKLGLLAETNRFLPLSRQHVLFFGHVGSGKSTELKFYADKFAKTGFFLPVEIDVDHVLDKNNLQYADLLMAMANALLDALKPTDIELPRDAIDKLQNWFFEKVKTRSEVAEFTNEVSGGAQLQAGVPLLAKLFATFTSAFKANKTYKDELRLVIRNSFTQLAAAFNQLIGQLEAALAEAGHKETVRVLFIVDGTDKLREDDRRRLFVQDAVLLLEVQALAVYTAPIALKYEPGLVGQLDSDLVLPMMKLQEQNNDRCEAGWRAIRDILLKRADRSLFETDEDIAQLVEYSGGHPRELLRLLKLCCELASAKIDAGVVTKAVSHLASDYRRMLEPEDYPRLVQIDRDPADDGNDETVTRLLYCLALLEYNDGSWRRCHPVIRTLEGYRRAAARTPP